MTGILYFIWDSDAETLVDGPFVSLDQAEQAKENGFAERRFKIVKTLAALVPAL